MNVKDYLERAEVIRNNELMSIADLVNEIGIAFNTLKRLQIEPETCALKTMRKLKLFVDKWEQKMKPQRNIYSELLRDLVSRKDIPLK